MTAVLTSATSDLATSLLDTSDDSTVDLPASIFTPSRVSASLGFTTGGRTYLRRIRITAPLTEPRQAKVQDFLVKIDNLLRSTGGQAAVVDPVIVKRVVEYLLVPSVYAGDMPSFYPLEDRGLLVRWTRGDDSLDLEFDVEGDVVALLKSGGQRKAGYLHEMWRPISMWLFALGVAA